jgi:hypothetical protein
VTELFENFEVNRSPRWPLLTKLAVGSLILHSTAVLAILYIPQVRETFNLANAFSGVQFRDEAYEKTRIEDRAIMLSLKDGKFQYPPGYFQNQTEPQEPQLVLPQIEMPPPPKIVSEAKADKSEAPKPEVSPKPSPLPSPSPAGPANAETAAAGTGGDAAAKEKEQREKQLDDVAKSAGIERPDEAKINKAPLKDWLKSADALLKKGDLDLTKEVEIVIEADRQPDGKLANVQVIRKDGDPRLLEVGKDLASAISDSGVLYFLSGTTHLRMTMKLDNANVSAKVESDAGTPDRADTLARTYGTLLTIGGLQKRGQTEGEIYSAAKVKAEGKQVVVNFNMSRDQATGILKKYTPPASPAT